MNVLTACILLVTADTHSAGFSSRLFDAMYTYTDDSTRALAGDVVDLPGEWGQDWTRRLREYGFWGVPGNHDDAAGFRAHSEMARVVCGDPEQPDFVAFGIDSEQVLGSYGSGLGWAQENYPDTPWVILTHRPFVSCIHAEGHGLLDRAWGQRAVATFPTGTVVVAGHEHVWCQAHMEGWTQIVVSTGGGKRYECGRHLPENITCEYLPDYPTFVRLDPRLDDLAIVGLTPDGTTERHLSILEGDGSWMEIDPAPPL